MGLLRPALTGLAAVAVALAGLPEPGPVAGRGPWATAAPSSQAAAPSAATAAYRSPADGAVLRLFDPPAVRWGRGHRGVDLATTDLTVRSPGDGVVSFSGTVVDRGVVTVLHPDGLRSSLEPVTGAPPAGTPVVAGDAVGRVSGPGHCGDRPCVHWGVRRGETYVDPLSLLGGATVVLLP